MAAPAPTIEAHRAHGSWTGSVETIEVEGESTVMLTICQTCHFIEAECNHEHNTWHDEQDNEGNPIQVLRCNFCNIDGT